LPALVLFWGTCRARHRDTFLAWVAACLLLVGTTGYVAFGQVAHYKKGLEQLVQAINDADPQRQLPVMVYRDFLPSVSFYRGPLAVMALGDKRETQFQGNPIYRDHYLEDEGELDSYLQGKTELFLVTRSKFQEEFSSRFLFDCRELYRQRKVAAYQCIR
jgi:hypothetical protein